MLIIDGGGTALKIWKRSEKGTLRCLKRIAGNFNAQTSSRAHLLKTLAATREIAQSDALLIGLAGLSDDAQKRDLHNALQRQKTLKGKSIRLMNDWELQLELHFPNQDGMVAVLGTGSVFAAKVNEKTVRVGGYGRWIGDRGSGVAIGFAAILQYLRALDGFFQDAAFCRAMRRYFKDREETLRKVYQDQFPAQTLAPSVIKLASKGNPTAQAILEAEAKAVAEFIALLRQKVRRPELALKLCGGLVEKPNGYREMIERAVAAQRA